MVRTASENYMEVDLDSSDELVNIRKQYYELTKSSTAEFGTASLAQVFEWANLKGYKFVMKYKNKALFEKIEISKVIL